MTGAGMMPTLARVLLPVALLMMGCSSEQSSASLDVDRYLAALTTTDPAEGFAMCGGLSTASLRGDCQSDLAERLLNPTSTMAEISVICDTIEETTWRNECWFMAADARAVTGPMVWGACEQTGRYRSFCFDHALQRELAAVPMQLGEEDAAQQAIITLLNLYFPDEANRVKQERFNRALAHRVGVRWRRGADFDPTLCAPLPEPLCRFAYLHSVSTDAVDQEAICAAPEQTAAVVQDGGGFGWTADGAEIAASVWADLCNSIHDGERGPPHLPRRWLLPIPRTQ
ncbi:MAG: hypothetical protein ACI8RZ_006661 [Myxococcota bacterium]|jgi:hypothetical protein